jgi:hypothetical protein
MQSLIKGRFVVAVPIQLPHKVIERVFSSYKVFDSGLFKMSAHFGHIVLDVKQQHIASQRLFQSVPSRAFIYQQRNKQASRATDIVNGFIRDMS